MIFNLLSSLKVAQSAEKLATTAVFGLALGLSFDPNAFATCSDLLLSTPLRDLYQPAQLKSPSDAPPWRLVKMLLEEPIPAIHREIIDYKIRDIDRMRQGHRYSDLLGVFRHNSDIWGEWALLRDRFSVVQSPGPKALVTQFLKTDGLIVQSIIGGKGLSADLLKGAHRLFLEDDNEGHLFSPGKFRRTIVGTDDRTGVYPTPYHVALGVADFIEYYEQNRRKVHPIELAWVAYRWISSLQPFRNGNKRVGRWAADKVLIENGYPPLTGLSDFQGLGEPVYANRSYDLNERPWVRLNVFVDNVRHSVEKMIELKQRGPHGPTATPRDASI